MKQIKVNVHKIMPVILLYLIDINFEKLVFLKSSSRRNGGEKRTEVIVFLYNNFIIIIILKMFKYTRM
jgi:hypothetical protein